MEEALRRVAAWRSGPLDLSCLKLTELPLLPATLTELNCSYNKLTSLLALPAALLATWEPSLFQVSI
jgi:Leucine-rich repeat (LRR) protein